VALWDLAGKAYSIPVYQMLGGKFRDKVRIYCDTEVIGRSDAQAMGKALKKRIESGFTFLKMDLGIEQIINEPGTLSGPPDLLEDYKKSVRYEFNTEAGPNETRKRSERTRLYDINNLAHPFTGLHITQKGFDMLEKYVEEVRSLIGYEIPLAVDHFGHVGVEDAIKLAARMDKYNLAWLEDLLPWRLTDQYVRLSRSCTTPICTGEDIFLKENFRPLLEKGAVSIIHPDLLTSGGILENKKIGDMAQEYAAAMAIHMAESPVACMAAVHCAAATENFMVLENHSVDIPWWDDMVCGTAKPLVKKGFITVPDTPGLGIESLNDEIVREHINPAEPGMWEPTGEWDNEWSYDRLWS
jgi:L-alanine-DL-glutamate epimerase-like enolase superfamily enzyme